MLATNRPISTGQELDQLGDGVDQQHPGVEPLPVDHRRRGRPLRRRRAGPGGWGDRLAHVPWSARCSTASLAHVASPGTASARRASCSTSSRASVRSRAAISSAPAAEAVVTVTDASPNIRLNAPSA